MTLDELRATLDRLEPGKMGGISHEVYAVLFPPGQPDEHARTACLAFAKSAGCRIQNNPQHKTVWFIKERGAAR
jgi:hypothetical protein